MIGHFRHCCWRITAILIIVLTNSFLPGCIQVAVSRKRCMRNWWPLWSTMTIRCLTWHCRCLFRSAHIWRCSFLTSTRVCFRSFKNLWRSEPLSKLSMPSGVLIKCAEINRLYSRRFLRFVFVAILRLVSCFCAWYEVAHHFKTITSM